jgi:hypothetical protein
MKIYLCDKGCCPAVEVGKTNVKIGEKGNLCTLKKREWTALKRKILNKEI